MKFSYNWIQSHIEEKLPAPEVLAETITFHAFEVESVTKAGDDAIFDIDVLPNRAHDCLSHRGIAREVAGLLEVTLKELQTSPITDIPLELPIEIKSSVCRRYTAVSMKGVSVGPSPTWLVESLQSVGQKSINSIVDIANYLMLDTGQPIHVFDLHKIDGGITVRAAHEGETIITLTEETKTLTPETLVIADYIGALAIAGIKGGKTAEVDFKTKDILIEVANFAPASVRKSSRSLNLLTDASKRFENDFSPEHTMDVMARCVSMIKEIAGGADEGCSDHYASPEQQKTISFSTKDIVRLLSATITTTTITEIFNRYHYTYTVNNDVITLTVPFFRSDITGAHDIAEEIGRIMGYDAFTEVLPPIPAREPNTIFEMIRAARAFLVQKGFREVMTYTFRKTGDINILSGITDKSALRTNLTEGLKESYDLNNKNVPLLGIKELKQFEIGTVFFKDTAGKGAIKEEMHVAWIDKSGIQELALEQFIQVQNVDMTLTLKTKLTMPSPFTQWSAYPYITRDIAVWVVSPVDKQPLLEMIKKFSEEHCVIEPYLFDEFTKDGRTSMAFRLVFQAIDRTLTDEEVSSWFETLIVQIKRKKCTKYGK